LIEFAHEGPTPSVSEHLVDQYAGQLGIVVLVYPMVAFFVGMSEVRKLREFCSERQLPRLVMYLVARI
jgi:hypothetical protein